MFKSRAVSFLSRFLIFLIIVESGFSQEASSGDLNSKVEALSEKVEKLESVLVKRLLDVEQKVAAMGNKENLEKEALKSLQEISVLIKKGKFDSATKNMEIFRKKYASTSAAKRAVKLQQILAVIGKDAPSEWSIEKWFQGESDVALDGKTPTLLVFWEIWCPHCKREVPKIQNFYANYKDKGLQIVGMTKVNRSATEEGVQKFIEEEGIQYPIAKENGNLSKYFNVTGVPAAAVVRNGEIVWRGHPASISEDLIKTWL